MDLKEIPMWVWVLVLIVVVLVVGGYFLFFSGVGTTPNVVSSTPNLPIPPAIPN